MHFTGLYEQFHDYSRDSEAEASDARALVARETEFQQEMIAALRADRMTSTWAIDDVIQRNRRLVAFWDGLSLAICHGIKEPRSFRAVPAAGDGIDVTVTPVDGELVVDPWPFSVERVTVGADGRRLIGPCEDEVSLAEALRLAPWVRVESDLIPPSDSVASG
jgi:hypothetical protein